MCIKCKINFKKWLKKSILKLRNIFLTNKNAKCSAGQRDRQHFKTGLYTDTGYPEQTSNLNLILKFLNEKVFNIYLTIKY